MNGTGFGRKGLPAQGSLGAVRAVPARPMARQDNDLARKREAFLAEERTRALNSRSDASDKQAASYQAALDRHNQAWKAQPQKSLVLAYVLWWFFAGFSAHRFYLGHTKSALQQGGAFVGGLLVIMVGSSLKLTPIAYLGGIAFLFGCLWILADIFLIPGLCRSANAGSDSPARFFD